jgi:ribosome-binding ATPase YchF (GTP1/OBG family)
MLIGLVGKPSCGKSTFFKASTLADVAIAAYPFTTIKPHHGIGYVKIDCIDKEFNVKCNPHKGYCVNSKRFVPVELLDVAGLVEGASLGKGLGNEFLSDLTSAVSDVKMLENELDLWYLGILNKVWKSFSRSVQQTKQELHKAVAKQFSGLKVNEEQVKRILLKLKYDTEKPSEWSEEELRNFCHELRHYTKPMIIAANKCDRPDASKNIKKLRENYPELIIVPCSADSELSLRLANNAGLIQYVPGDSDFKIIKDLNQKQKDALNLIKKNVLGVYLSTGVQEVLNKTVFELLKYIAIFPAGVHKLADSKGNVLPDCFLLPAGSTALDFAYAIHSDFGKNFIKAIDVRTKQAVGKEHKLKHRDGFEIVTR